MRADDFIINYVGLDVSDLPRALRCLAWTKKFPIRPDSQLNFEDVNKSADEFGEIFVIWSNRQDLTVGEFLGAYCKIPENCLMDAMVDLSDFFDTESLEFESDMMSYIEEYFDDIEAARDEFLDYYNIGKDCQKGAL